MATHNTDAVNNMVEANPVLDNADNGPLVQLALTLAAQMDDAEGDPSTRLSASYLSVLKDLRRAAREESAGKTPGGKLGKLKALHGGKAR